MMIISKCARQIRNHAFFFQFDEQKSQGETNVIVASAQKSLKHSVPPQYDPATQKELMAATMAV